MKSRFVVRWLVLLGLMVVVTSCQAANPSPTADLMFCANQAVFSMSLGNDGKTELRKVVDLPPDATCPVWSPDGKFAVLYRYRQIEPFVQEDSLSFIDRQTGTIREVYRFGPSDNEWTIHWLPDGIELLLASARDALKQGNTKCDSNMRSFNHIQGLFCWAAYADFYQSKISLQNAVEGFERLTNSPMLRCELELSLDGSKLAFTHGTLCSEGTGDEGNVSILDPNSKVVSLVIDATSYLAKHPGSVNRSVPAGWSPNGEQLAISSHLDNYVAQNFLADSTGVHPVLPDGVNWMTWLPDGQNLLWFNQGFGVTNIESGKVETLPVSIDPRHSIGSWGVSPNGRYLAWQETDAQDKTGQIRIFDFTTGTTSAVLGVMSGTLVWSPDSQLLAFPVKTRLQPNKCDYRIDIYVVKPDASGLRNLTEGQQMKTLPCGFPGGMGWGWYDRFAKDVQWVPHS